MSASTAPAAPFHTPCEPQRRRPSLSPDCRLRPEPSAGTGQKTAALHDTKASWVEVQQHWSNPLTIRLHSNTTTGTIGRQLGNRPFVTAVPPSCRTQATGASSATRLGEVAASKRRRDVERLHCVIQGGGELDLKPALMAKARGPGQWRSSRRRQQAALTALALAPRALATASQPADPRQRSAATPLWVDHMGPGGRHTGEQTG